jgi:hypothetical protein
VHVSIPNKGFFITVYGDCCEKEQSDCTRNEIHRLIEYCDNRHGAQAQLCEGITKLGSNKEKWEQDAYMTALSRENHFTTTSEYILFLYTKPEVFEIIKTEEINSTDVQNATEKNGNIDREGTTEKTVNVTEGDKDNGIMTCGVANCNETNLEANKTGHVFNITMNQTIVAPGVIISSFNTEKSNLTRITRKNIVTSISKEYQENVPEYSITRVYEKVQVCGDVEVTPFAAFVITLKSTTRCIPYDRWEYLEDQDCDNTENSTGGN